MYIMGQWKLHFVVKIIFRGGIGYVQDMFLTASVKCLSFIAAASVLNAKLIGGGLRTVHGY